MDVYIVIHERKDASGIGGVFRTFEEAKEEALKEIKLYVVDFAQEDRWPYTIYIEKYNLDASGSDLLQTWQSFDDLDFADWPIPREYEDEIIFWGSPYPSAAARQAYFEREKQNHLAYQQRYLKRLMKEQP